MSHYVVTKKTETKTAVIQLCDDGIIRVMFKNGAEIDIKQLNINFIAYYRIMDKKKYPFIYYAEDGSVSYTSDARDFAKQTEEAFPKICIAIVVETLAHKLVANFFMKFNKPGYPFKVTDKMREATRWCLEEQKKHELVNSSDLDHSAE